LFEKTTLTGKSHDTSPFNGITENNSGNTVSNRYAMKSFIIKSICYKLTCLNLPLLQA
jgi:hypothetical protein